MPSAGMQSWCPTSFWTSCLAVGMGVVTFSWLAFTLHLCCESIWRKGLCWKRGVGGGSALALSEVSGKLKQKIHQLPSPIRRSVSWLCTQTSSWARDLLVKCSLKKNGALADGKLGMGELDWGCPACIWGLLKGRGTSPFWAAETRGMWGCRGKCKLPRQNGERAEPQP